jgi:hypothetical protein
MASGNKYVYRGKPEGLLATSNAGDSARSVTNPNYEAIVVDVILDHFHPQYSADGYNVGAIKVRIFSVHDGRDDELLDWADPLDSTIQEMPLIGELVILQKILGNFFYMRKINLAHRLQESSMLKLNSSLNNRTKKLNSSITSGNDEITPTDHEFGGYYKPDSRVRPLKHFEGDVLIQGRMGHSVRFGSSQIDPSSKGMAPNLIFRTGQAKDVETNACTSDKVFGLILEDVNKDVSSIWMTSDQVVPYEPTIVNAGSLYRSLKNPPQQYDGASIIINSDRVVLGSKKTHIMLFAQEEIYLNSFKNTSIDTDSSIILTANIDIRNLSSRNIDNIADNDYTISTGNDITIVATKNFSVLADKMFLGSAGDDYEPIVGGTSLSKFLARLIITLLGVPAQVLPWTTSKGTIVPPPTPGIATFTHVITPVGPAVLNPEIVGGLVKLYSELIKPNSGQQIPLPFAGAPFNSGDVFINLGNEVPKIQKNDFKAGEVTVVENNKWTLTDPYYRVV